MMTVISISSSTPLVLQPRNASSAALSTLKPSDRSFHIWKSSKKFKNQDISRRRRRGGGGGICRADLGVDAPFAAAIGACMLTSLVSPVPDGESDDDVSGGGGGMDSTDSRFAVMGIISFIPYFNWMSWVFAWLDSGKQRYLVYAVVYLAPYLRTNLSLSPEDSWLPIASIFLCIIHIQLEASIRNGDLNEIQFFGKAVKLFSPFVKKEDNELQNHQDSPKGSSKKRMDLPSSQRNIRDEFREWETPRKHVRDAHHSNESPERDEEENKAD